MTRRKKYRLLIFFLLTLLLFSGLLSYFRNIRFYSPLNIEICTALPGDETKVTVTGISPTGGRVELARNGRSYTYDYRFFKSILISPGGASLTKIIIVSGQLHHEITADEIGQLNLSGKGTYGEGFLIPESVREPFQISAVLKSMYSSDLFRHYASSAALILLKTILAVFFFRMFYLFMMSHLMRRQGQRGGIYNDHFHSRLPWSIPLLILPGLISFLPVLFFTSVLEVSPAELYNLSSGMSNFIIWLVSFTMFFWLYLTVILQKSWYVPLSVILIFFVYYFFYAPSAYAGSFRFNGSVIGYYQDYVENGFLNSILKKDTGYLVIFQRLFYAIICSIPFLRNFIPAIAGFSAPVFIALFFSWFCSRHFRILEKNDFYRFAMIFCISILGVYSMKNAVPNEMIITDVTYYGVLFSLLYLFLPFRRLSSMQLFVLVFFNSVLMLSKAQYITFLPLYLYATIIVIKNKEHHKIFFFAIPAIAAAIQLLVILSGMGDIDALFEQARQANIRTTLDIKEMSPLSMITSAAFYYIKSYHYFLFFKHTLSPAASIFSNIAAIALIIFLFYISFKMYRRGIKVAALFFWASNMISFICILFFIKTAGEQYFMAGSRPIYEMPLQDLFTAGNFHITFHRYTIFIHLPLILSILILISNTRHLLFHRENATATAKKWITPGLLLSFVILNILYHERPSYNREFWTDARHNLWAYECSQYMKFISDEEYYFPLYGYPDRKLVANKNRSLLEVISPPFPDTVMIPHHTDQKKRLIQTVITFTENIVTRSSGHTVYLNLADSAGKTIRKTPSYYSPGDGLNYLYFNFDGCYHAKMLYLTDSDGSLIHISNPVFIAGNIHKE